MALSKVAYILRTPFSRVNLLHFIGLLHFIVGILVATILGWCLWGGS